MLSNPIWPMDNSKAPCCLVIASGMPEAQSIARVSGEWPEQNRWHSRRHRVSSTAIAPTVVAIASPDLGQYRSRHRTSTRSETKDEYKRCLSRSSTDCLRLLTSDRDRTGGLTQSSQHLDKRVNRTSGGGAPSHWVRN